MSKNKIQQYVEDQNFAYIELADLLKLESGLSDWEVCFIKDISITKWGNSFTTKQLNKIHRLWDKHCR